MASNKKYWKSVEELNENSTIVEALQQNEFVTEIPTDEFLGDKETLEASSTTRRDFLKYVGFTTAAASLAACEGPVIKSIPYVVAPDEIVPGVANYYASTIADGFDFANVLVKTREGRPIKIERNDLSMHNGSVNARVHASVLSLYDNNRVKAPLLSGKEVSWSDFDAAVAGKMNEMQGKEVVLLTQTFASPSTSKLIKEFTTKFSNVRHVVYDTVSSSEALDAFQSVYGVRAMADYDFSKAEVIVSVGADFLGDWQGGGFDAGYAKGRVPKNGNMSRHVQFEANMSLTGANADKRVPVKPSQQLQVLKALTGNGSTSGLSEKVAAAVASAKAQLAKAGSKGVVVTGFPSVEAQTMVLQANANSVVMDAAAPRMTRQGSTAEVAAVMQGVMNGSVKGLITVGVDPVYSFPNSAKFAEAYKKLEMSLAFAMKKDATAELAQMVAATPHYLESWGDAQIKKGSFSLMQPTIRPLFSTRQFQECLLTWTGNTAKYNDYIKDTWSGVLGGTSWNKALEAGVVTSAASVSNEEISAGTTTLSSATSNGALAASQGGGGLELTLYTKTSLGDGQQANNPWLQEMPDPITRTSWDNYVTVSKADAAKMGLVNENVANGGLNGSYVNVKMGDVVVENVPVLIQPGQAEGSVGLALGYGKTAAIQEEMQTGVNAYALYNNFSSVQNVTLEKVTGMHEFACVQLHNTMMGRDIIRETSLEVFNTAKLNHEGEYDWNPMPKVSRDHEEIPVTSPEADLWTSFDRSVGHHFNLAIDLNACTGCGACVIACHAENNVPVVGKQEVRKSRDMHWLRIDRYYSSEENFDGDMNKKVTMSGLSESLSQFGEMEDPSANPQVAFQPVMCQHCNHAPCETVCPVAATSHGRQGQNQMAYNRCVGTGYCANNCPYKVRRFNWFLYNENDEFDYNMNNDLGRMVLNPDVNVRSRGVMEKCSMCIQMTQLTILEAKRDGRPVGKDEFKTACSAACESGAMVFGDINDHESQVYKEKKDKRMYHLLEAVGTEPNVFYQTKVRNSKES